MRTTRSAGRTAGFRRATCSSTSRSSERTAGSSVRHDLVDDETPRRSKHARAVHHASMRLNRPGPLAGIYFVASMALAVRGNRGRPASHSGLCFGGHAGGPRRGRRRDREWTTCSFLRTTRCVDSSASPASYGLGSSCHPACRTLAGLRARTPSLRQQGGRDGPRLRIGRDAAAWSGWPDPRPCMGIAGAGADRRVRLAGCRNRPGGGVRCWPCDTPSIGAGGRGS